VSSGLPAPRPTIRYEAINTPTSEPGEHFMRYDQLHAQAPAHLGTAADNHPFWLVGQTPPEDLRLPAQPHRRQTVLRQLTAVADAGNATLVLTIPVFRQSPTLSRRRRS